MPFPFWKKHSEEGVTEDQLKNFDQDFLKMSNLELLGVFLAARYLDDKQLKEEIREVNGMVNDYTPKEEDETRREYVWDF
uniref:SKP1 component dimerisation domain-containing protein n=1 Tax=Solanum lycopersicum TaxID=4081 RepID=A0A3Q7ECR1_SOLLC